MAYPGYGGQTTTTTTTFVTVPQSWNRVTYQYPAYYNRRIDFVVRGTIAFHERDPASFAPCLPNTPSTLAYYETEEIAVFIFLGICLLKIFDLCPSDETVPSS